VLISEGAFEAAIPFLGKSLDLDSRQPATHYAVATALAKTRRLNEAVEHYRQAIPTDSAEPWNDYGLCLARLGKMEEAIGILREGRSRHPQDATICVTLGRVLANQQNFEEAISLFSEALKTAPQNADAHASLGPLLAMRGDVKLAIDHLTKAINQKPEDPIAHFNLGRALATQGNTSEAARHFEEALRLKPDYTPAQIELSKLGKDSQP
jgi:tetratricopeptide (TPR) repeat protein